MYKSTQDRRDSISRVGSHSTKLHPARGMVSTIRDDAALDLGEKLDRLTQLKKGLLAERGDAEERARKARNEVAFIKREGARGRYSDPMHLRRLEDEAGIYGRKVQATQEVIAEINDTVKALNKSVYGNVPERFMSVARQMLPAEVFQQIFMSVMNEARATADMHRMKEAS